MQIPKLLNCSCKTKEHTIVDKETSDHVCFFCKKCHAIQVFSSEKVRERVAWERTVGRFRPKHSWDRPVLYSIPKGR